MKSVFKPSAKKVSVARKTEALNADQKEIADKKFTKAGIILCAVLSALTYNKVDELEKEGKTVLLPFGSKSGDMIVAGDSANDNYVTSILRLIIDCFVTLSPATVSEKTSELMSLVHPERNEALRQKLKERIDYFKQFTTVSEVGDLVSDQNRTITENPSISYEKPKGVNKVYRISFSVEKKTIVGEKVSQTRTIKMSIDYAILASRFWLLDINQG